MATPEQDSLPPLVILRSVNREGETFALHPRSLLQLQERGVRLHGRPRIFLAHETRADYETIHGAIVPQVVALLTGQSEEQLRQLVGDIIFQDPVTEQNYPRV